jgi:hypothetical protein
VAAARRGRSWLARASRVVCDEESPTSRPTAPRPLPTLGDEASTMVDTRRLAPSLHDGASRETSTNPEDLP